MIGCAFSSPKNNVTSPNSKTPVDNPNEIQNQGQNRKSPLKECYSKTIVNMPSSPYQSTLDALSEDDHDHEHEHEHENDQQQQNVLNDEISKMINMSPFKSSPNRANRLDTGNLIMSNQNKDDDKRIKHQLQIQNSILMMMMKVNIMKDIKILQKVVLQSWRRKINQSHNIK